MRKEHGMANGNPQVPRDTAQRLVLSVERLLSSLGGTISAVFVESREAELLRGLPGPVAALQCRMTRSAAGGAALVLPGATAIGLARLLLGESPEGVGASPGPDEEDALRELANQAASGLSTALGEILGKPVGFETPTFSWHPGGGAELPTWPDGVDIVLQVSLGGATVEASLVVPRSAVAPTPSPVMEASLPPLAEKPPRKTGNGMEMLLDISLPVTVELGRTRMMIRDILHLAPGSVLELDKLAGEPVDILINEKSIARGEVVVIDESFGVRLTSIVTPSERVASLR
jgi:flagellar motor switch protein FliN